MKTINEYSESIENIINNISDKKKLYSECRELVLMYGRRGGFLAYKILFDSLHDELPEHTLENVSDVLDALSGQCHSEYRIGSGTYHLNIRPSEILSNKRKRIIDDNFKIPCQKCSCFWFCSTW